MNYDIDPLLEKLTEIDEQLAMAVLEVPRDSLANSRLKHIKLLVEYVRAGVRKMQVTRHAIEKGVDTSGGKAADSE
ncbi:MAG TPA: hypothetical protein VFK84_15605 [Burkholderiales bacterium]|nr:hypothetical protein [Burkholderiales bacterium]